MVKNIFLFLVVLFSWSGLGIQLAILLHGTPENGMTPLEAVGRFLIFFTILTNLLVAISTTQLLVGSKGTWLIRQESLAAIAVYILIVGIVYNAVLRNLWQPQGWQLIADNLLHVITPLLYPVYWWKWIINKPIKWKYAIYWLMFPAAYLVYALLRGAIEGFYAYPFIDAKELGYTRVLINAGFVMLAFVLVGFFIIWLSRKRRLNG